jgi:uncharacterized protein with HEPN domain
MTGKDRIILQKINGYIDDVKQYIEGYSFEDFMADKKTISACAFSVTQISEPSTMLVTCRTTGSASDVATTKVKSS